MNYYAKAMFKIFQTHFTITATVKITFLPKIVSARDFIINFDVARQN